MNIKLLDYIKFKWLVDDNTWEDREGTVIKTSVSGAGGVYTDEYIIVDVNYPDMDDEVEINICDVIEVIYTDDNGTGNEQREWEDSQYEDYADDDPLKDIAGED